MFAYCSTAALLLSLGSSVLAAQGTTTASVSGIVVDDSGRGLEDADVQVINRATGVRSEEHTSELQSQSNLVCRLLLEKKKKKKHQQCIEHEGKRHIPGSNEQ